MNHLRFLRYVDEVARVGSIRQAAERLHVAPSAVNRRIQDLEDELGTPLFERLPRGMRLTAAGEVFVRYIRSRAAELEQVRSEIEELQGVRRGLVKVAVSQALAPLFLPKAIAAFRARHPLALFRTRIGDWVHAFEALRAFEIDLALVFNPPPQRDIERIAEFEQKLMVTMHRGHPLAKRAALRLRDLVDYPLVLPDHGTGDVNCSTVSWRAARSSCARAWKATRSSSCAAACTTTTRSRFRSRSALSTTAARSSRARSKIADSRAGCSCWRACANGNCLSSRMRLPNRRASCWRALELRQST